MRTTRHSKGYFIAFEGGEGSGKSTQARLLHAWLESLGIPTLLSREPGGTPLGGRIRELLLNPELGPKHRPVSHRTELLLYEADRAQNVEERIRPALDTGQVVICDRFSDSSTVYQGICRGLGETQTAALNRYATGGLVPDKVVLLDIPAALGLGRVQARTGGGDGLDRMESEKLTFHKKVRAGFLKLACKAPSRYVILDARKGQDELALKLRHWVEPFLRRRGIWKC